MKNCNCNECYDWKNEFAYDFLVQCISLSKWIFLIAFFYSFTSVYTENILPVVNNYCNSINTNVP